MGIFNFSRHVSKFLDNIQNETQERFIKQARKKGPDPVIARMSKIDKEIKELEKILKEY